jgi:hypothetical protein
MATEVSIDPAAQPEPAGSISEQATPIPQGDSANAAETKFEVQADVKVEGQLERKPSVRPSKAAEIPQISGRFDTDVRLFALPLVLVAATCVVVLKSGRKIHAGVSVSAGTSLA